MCCGGSQGSNDFAAAAADSRADCRAAYAPLVAKSVIGIAERWRISCPRTQIIMRGLSVYGVSYGRWPNLYTVVGTSSCLQDLHPT